MQLRNCNFRLPEEERRGREEMEGKGGEGGEEKCGERGKGKGGEGRRVENKDEMVMFSLLYVTGKNLALGNSIK